MRGIHLVETVWNHHQTSIGWETLNNGLYQALHIAIAARMDFAPQDFDRIEKHYRPGYWLGEHGFEIPYSWAIAYENVFFIKAFEDWKNRPAFIANDVKISEPHPRLIHRLGMRKRSRLALWSTFGVSGGSWKVTSVHQDYIIACREGERSKWTRDNLKFTFPAPIRKKPETVKTKTRLTR